MGSVLTLFSAQNCYPLHLLFVFLYSLCSYYDAYRGVIVYFRVVDGTIKKGDRIVFMASDKVTTLFEALSSPLIGKQMGLILNCKHTDSSRGVKITNSKLCFSTEHSSANCGTI